MKESKTPLVELTSGASKICRTFESFRVLKSFPKPEKRRTTTKPLAITEIITVTMIKMMTITITTAIIITTTT